MRTYPQELKESMVARMCMPGGPSALQLSRETGICNVSLSNWKRKFVSGDRLNKHRSKWNDAEKLDILLESQGLSDEDLGIFLRKKGLHSTDLAEIKADLKSALSKSGSKKPGRPKKDLELQKSQEEVKKLRRDIRRKDKVLAEQAAIIILKKKVQDLWGDEEEDDTQ